MPHFADSSRTSWEVREAPKVVIRRPCLDMISVAHLAPTELEQLGISCSLFAPKVRKYFRVSLSCYCSLNIESALCFLSNTSVCITARKVALACSLNSVDAFGLVSNFRHNASAPRTSRRNFQSANHAPSSSVATFQNKPIMIVIDGAKINKTDFIVLSGSNDTNPAKPVPPDKPAAAEDVLVDQI